MIKFAATSGQFLFKSPLAIIGTTFITNNISFSLTDKEDLPFIGYDQYIKENNNAETEIQFNIIN